MMKTIGSFLLMLMLLCTTATAQNLSKQYDVAKALYDQKQYAQAFPKFQELAKQGHKKSQYRLGRCYDKGHGTAENDEKAFYWYKKSADQGYAKAQYQVGKCYKDGEGVDKDRVKAFEFFKKAAYQDYAKAQLAVGKCYMKGKGTKMDQAKARSYFLKAWNNEDLEDRKDIRDDLQKDAREGDEDAIKILKIVGK